MRLKLAVPILVAANLMSGALFGQPSQSERYKYAPLVTTAKLWNLIHYLHPRLTGDSTAWDAALMAALPKIETAHSDEDLAVALDAMLETLHDPCTRIASGLPGKGISVQSFEGNTMVIHAGNGDLSGSLGAGLMLKMGIPQTSNLVWDLRGSRMPYSLSSRPDIRQLSANGVGYAYREHLGYNSSSLRIVDPPRGPVRRASSTWRQVYLIDKDSAVPFQAIVDQINGRTAILSEDPPTGYQAGFTELFHVLGKVVAEVRVAEILYPDRTTDFAPTRVVLNRGEDAVKAAINAITSGWGMPGERPDFEAGPSAFHDMPYADTPYPSRELRLLAAMRIWGILHYFDPQVATIGDKWDDVLVEMLPKFANAKDAHEYHLAAAEMAARTGDAGCSARSAETQELFGGSAAPLEVRFIENQPVITRLFKAGPAQAGDVILKINGKPVQNRIEELTRYIAAPSPAALQTQIARFLLTAKAPGNLTLTVRGKDDATRDITIALNEANQKAMPVARGGDATRLINERIGYADLERVESSEVAGIFEKFGQTAAIIFDLRGYPRGTALTIAAHLAEGQPVVAEMFRNLVGSGVESGAQDNHIGLLESEVRISSELKPHYAGKTVALIDDLSPSLTGESAMYLKVGNSVLVGSTAFPLFSSYATVCDVPGGIKLFFSGQASRWPGGKPVLPEGVRPEVEARPTLAGIRAGRDEVLDAAVAYLSK